MVSAASLVCMTIAGIIAFGLPITLLVYFRKKKDADILPFFIGCGVMLLFAFVLEQLAHAVILGSAAGTVIQKTPVLYAVYGGLMAGLFEETGRFCAFRTVMKKDQKNADALMYGAGHGGFEAMLLLGLTSINNIVYSVMINTGVLDVLMKNLSGDALVQLQNTEQALLGTPSWQFLLAGAERISAVILQIALSVLVWFAVKKRKAGLYPLAILIHFLVDTGTVLMSQNGVPLVLLEIVVLGMAVLTAFFAGFIWRKYAGPEKRVQA